MLVTITNVVTRTHTKERMVLGAMLLTQLLSGSTVTSQIVVHTTHTTHTRAPSIKLSSVLVDEVEPSLLS